MRLGIALFAALLLTMFTASREACADSDAGQEAFDRGDIPRAASLWRAAAEQGDARAQLGLGRILLTRADMKGWRHLRASAAGGYIPAELEMAMLHLHGMYVPRDVSKCVDWLERATGHPVAEESNHRLAAARARFVLAMAYSQGSGVTRNRVKGAALMRRAADAGHAGAQHGFADALEKGKGVKRDLVEAHTYYVLSWKQDSKEARGSALAVRKRLTPAQFAESRARVRAWLDAKDAGKHGWVYGYQKRRSRGEEALETLEGMNRRVLGMVLMFAGLSDMKCERVWLRSRVVTRPRTRRSKRWVERWTVDVCGKTKHQSVTFQGVGKDIRWTVGSGRIGAS